MGAAQLVVRAEVPDPADRAPFDHWYATDHLPWAIRVFAARRGWRCWTGTDPTVHYAFYEFTNVDEARAAIDPSRIAPLVADFDRVGQPGDAPARDPRNRPRVDPLDVLAGRTPESSASDQTRFAWTVL
jgi:hypothetical protein